jgi:hypothetical protein
MAYIGSIGSIIGKTAPINGTSNVPVDGVITITFVYDMVLDTVNNSTIVLLDDGSNKISAQVTYQNKVATLTPDANLEPQTRYQVVIKGGLAGVKSVTNSTLLTDYNFNYETANVIPPGQVILLSPVDRSVFSGYVGFTWTLIPEFSMYELQISQESKFGSLIFSSDVTGNSITPDVNFDHEQIYHWRVRAISDSATPVTGPWSDTWQFRYNLAAPVSPGIPATPTETPVFDVGTIVPGPEEYFVSGLGSISVQFTDTVDPLTVNSNTFIVKADYIDLAGEPVRVDGYFEIDDTLVQFFFNPSNSPFNTNTIFTIELRKEITSVNEGHLADDIMWTFATTFTPYYSKVIDVRNELRGLIDDVSDLEIMRMIHSVSQWADQIAALPYGEVNEDYIGETQQETTNAIFYHNYTRFESAFRILNQKTILRSSMKQGGMRQIGDLIVKDPLYLSPDYKIALQRLESLRNTAKMYLTMGRDTFPLPKSAIKGERLFPYPLNKRNSF